MNTLILMNKDEKLAELSINGNYIVITKVFRELPEYLLDVQLWLYDRILPFGRYNISELLKMAQINNLYEYINITKGISLTDTFWIKHSNDKTAWESINPYRNRFSRVISQVALDLHYIGGDLRSPSPDYNIDGSADKCWKRINGIIYLYKASGDKFSGISGNRPYIEYYASQLTRALNITSYVEYDIKVRETIKKYKKAYCICKAFTNEYNGYAPIGNTKYSKYEIEEMDKEINDTSSYILREMLIVDSILLNMDRHMGNYGFIFDTDTFRLKQMAPIFDLDCSLGFNISLQNTSIREAYTEALKIKPTTNVNGGGYINQAKWAMTSKIANNIKNIYPFEFNRIGGELDLEPERLDFMEFIINSQIRSILSK